MLNECNHTNLTVEGNQLAGYGKCLDCGKQVPIDVYSFNRLKEIQTSLDTFDERLRSIENSMDDLTRIVEGALELIPNTYDPDDLGD